MAAPKGNQNARKGQHPRVQVPFSGELLDAIYECLAALGECAEDDPQRVREFVWGVVGGYVRQKIERDRAMIL